MHLLSARPFQIQSWSVALVGHNIVAIASSGSVQTMAYVLPPLVQVSAHPELKPEEGPIGLVVLPTHALCALVRDGIVKLL